MAGRSSGGHAKPIPSGTHVGGDYRSTTWTGDIKHVIKPATKPANIEYAIKPDKNSRHSGEPPLIHRYGRSIHRV